MEDRVVASIEWLAIRVCSLNLALCVSIAGTWHLGALVCLHLVFLNSLEAQPGHCRY